MEISSRKAAQNHADINTLVLIATKSTLVGVSKSAQERVEKAKKDGAFAGAPNDTVFFRDANLDGYQHLLVVSVGDSKNLTPESFRSAAGAVFTALKGHKLSKAAVDFGNFSKTAKKLPESLYAFAEGLLLSDYAFDEYKDMKKKDKKEKNYAVTFVGVPTAKDQQLKKLLASAAIVSESIDLARRLGDTPGNLMPPEKLAEEAQNAAKGTKVKVTVWDKARIKKERMGGLYGVSLGSAMDPRFMILEYNGAAKSKKPVVFVGKGLTFDSGGISIKPAQSMEEMKYDMCGGANVIATVIAIAKLKLKVNVVGLVPSTENMPGPLATKPGDILIARNGKTVEVNNTDAEGRLILMDALSYASELKPAAIFDAATLTGAMVIALSNIYTGVFTRDRKLMNRIQAAADATGELVWPMPIHDHHLADMKGTYADLSNISNYKGGGSSTAAAFLEQFVDEGIPWAHFDIAGTAWFIGNRLTYMPKKNASGAIVRTFVELAKSYS